LFEACGFGRGVSNTRTLARPAVSTVCAERAFVKVGTGSTVVALVVVRVVAGVGTTAGPARKGSHVVVSIVVVVPIAGVVSVVGVVAIAGVISIAGASGVGTV